MIGNTDAHYLEQIGNTFTKITMPAHALSNKEDIHDAKDFKKFVQECSEERYDHINKAVIRYIKRGDVKIVTRPLKPSYVAKTLRKLAF